MQNSRALAAAIAGIRTIGTLFSAAGFQSFSRLVIASTFAAFPAVARASLLSPELEDIMAEIVSWVALIVAPITLIVVFWLVHILPEKIAEKRKHPQAKAIQVLCLLSLAFGGLLWPLAWLWAYSKPVMYKLAYGTDVAEPEHEPPPAPTHTNEPRPVVASEMRLLEQKIAELEAQIAQAEDFRGGRS
jgi:CBS domain containing-hemolysin-like protein